VPSTDPPPVEPSTATDTISPTATDTTSPTATSGDSKKDSPREKRKMKAALDDFLTRGRGT
jgi:hypothetical protein